MRFGQRLGRVREVVEHVEQRERSERGVRKRERGGLGQVRRLGRSGEHFGRAVHPHPGAVRQMPRQRPLAAADVEDGRQPLLHEASGDPFVYVGRKRVPALHGSREPEPIGIPVVVGRYRPPRRLIRHQRSLVSPSAQVKRAICPVSSATHRLSSWAKASPWGSQSGARACSLTSPSSAIRATTPVAQRVHHRDRRDPRRSRAGVRRGPGADTPRPRPRGSSGRLPRVGLGEPQCLVRTDRKSYRPRSLGWQGDDRGLAVDGGVAANRVSPVEREPQARSRPATKKDGIAPFVVRATSLYVAVGSDARKPVGRHLGAPQRAVTGRRRSRTGHSPRWEAGTTTSSHRGRFDPPARRRVA